MGGVKRHSESNELMTSALLRGIYYDTTTMFQSLFEDVF